MVSLFLIGSATLIAVQSIAEIRTPHSSPAWYTLPVLFLIIVVKAFETTGLRLSRDNAELWFMAYLPSVVGFVIIWFLLFWAGRPYLFKRRVRAEVAT